MKKLRWTKSTDGYTYTHDGRFHIEPIYLGKDTAQCYHLYRKNETGRKCLASYVNTQKEAKEIAEFYA